MNLLNDLKSDLLEKKLWPVALLLVAALIAVPVLLGRSGGSSDDSAAASAAAPVAAAAASSGSTEKVVLDATTATGNHDRKGKVRDPFAQSIVKTSAVTGASSASGSAAAGTGTSAPTGSSGTSASSGASGAGSASSGSGATTPVTTPSSGSGTSGTSGTSTTPTTTGTLYYLPPKVSISFGRSSSTKHYKNIKRLSAFPSVDEPYVYYLGPMKGGNTLAFAVARGVVHSGQGRCNPSPTDCKILVVKTGQRALVGVPNAWNGVITHYALRIISIKPGGITTSREKAGRIISDVNKDGVHLLRAALGLLAGSSYRWSTRFTAFVPKSSSKK